MESEGLKIMEEERKRVIAVSWRTKEEHLELFDPNYEAFVRLMVYRRMIAKQWYDAKDPELKNEVQQSLNHCNEKIREILGL